MKNVPWIEANQNLSIGLHPRPNGYPGFSNLSNYKQLIKKDGFSFPAWLTGPLGRNNPIMRPRLWLPYPGCIERCSTVILRALRDDSTTATDVRPLSSMNVG